jgi:23S rRNA (adenine2503-C2)-methyltransferase
MGCRFCASTIGGLVRNLEPSEMAGQIYGIEKDAGIKVSNIVVMGTGEPLDNLDNLLTFIHIINDPHGINISARNITVSTCGLVEKMKLLAKEKLQITLAISLHAPDQEKRERLMPVAKSVDIHDLVDEAARYFEATGRRITFEYALVAGENDSAEDAEKLAKLLHGLNAHVNLIPVNPVTEAGFVQPDRTAVEAFLKKLEKKGINGTIRREMGRDIDGACGQLRRKHLS